MLKIGEMAGFCGIPTKTLRFYNELNLLKPQYIDPSTKYRFYNESQLKRLVLILDLKDVGFALKEISLLLDNISDAELVDDLLRKKATEIEENIRREELKLDNIKSISNKLLEGINKNKDSQKSSGKINEINEKVTTLDSCTSIDRHTLEESIWL